ncbi:MAG: DUF4199 domain-containing protein [Bacteroidetes bacterium]|nr:MAG: DUF4199 domain-containing protein [Bacteroidota bacterium]
MKQTYLWGALAGAFILIETLVGNQLDIFKDPSTKLYILVINLLTLGLGIYLALRDYKQRNNGHISFARCMFNGILISAMAAIVTAIGYVIYFNYINPDVKVTYMKEAETFFVKEKDSTATTIVQYKENFVVNYNDTVRTTQADRPRIEQMASDSAKVVQTKLDKAGQLFTFSGAVISFTGPLVLIGLLLSVIVASVIATRKQQ